MRCFFGSLLLALLFPALSGCAGPHAAPCAVLVPYSAQDDLALKAEIDAAALPQVHRYLRDYAGLRAQVRAVCPVGN